jgi:DHA3 family macrolide efflux protein-like MFS transporter
MSMGTLLVGLAPANSFWIALAGIGIMAIFITIGNGSFMAILQTVVAPEMQGRIFTVLGSIVQAMTPIGLLIGGPLADRFGVQLWYLLSTVAVLVMSAAMLLSPTVMQLEDHRAPQPAAEAAD